MPSTANKIAATNRLQSALAMAGMTNSAGSVSPSVLQHIKSAVQDAIDLIQERDPIKRHTAMIVLALQDSTEIRTSTTTAGEPVEHVWVKDRELFNWAIKKAHWLTRTEQ